ncbi:FHA domain-containing protein FHA2 [Zea mays]|uniref:FHA domain-containing protein FHA2 n=1 Tax=Zea mays TaxID=4577 RepID=A0A1D6KJT0_MAIZE|nr:FHA domain-containing protein FHA2 [Zea mays]
MGDAGDKCALRLAATARKWLEDGRVVCSLRVGAPLTDAEGRWHAGAIAVAADNVCAAAVFTALGADVLTVQYSLSYFSPAHLDEEVEMEGRVVGRKAALAAATVEVRKKESGELVAICRQWMAPLSTTKVSTSTSSKL